MFAKSKYPYWVYLTIIFVTLQLLDGILTSIGVYRYGMLVEANPIAAYTFEKFGLYQSAILWKAFSFSLFFGLLWFCTQIRWSLKDFFRIICGGKPISDKAYAMRCFNIAGTIIALISLWGGIGWIYIHIVAYLETQRFQ